MGASDSSSLARELPKIWTGPMRLVRELGWAWCLMFVAVAVASSWLGAEAVGGIAAWVGGADWKATPARVTQVDPARPGRSVRNRADLAHAGVSGLNTLGFYGSALMSALVLAMLGSQGWQKAGRLKVQALLAAADKAALEAYFHGSPEEALSRLREFGGLLESAARESEAESCAQAAFEHSRALKYAQPPLDPPMEYSGHVYRCIESEDRRIREPAGTRPWARAAFPVSPPPAAPPGAGRGRSARRASRTPSSAAGRSRGCRPPRGGPRRR